MNVLKGSLFGSLIVVLLALFLISIPVSAVETKRIEETEPVPFLRITFIS